MNMASETSNTCQSLDPTTIEALVKEINKWIGTGVGRLSRTQLLVLLGVDLATNSDLWDKESGNNADFIRSALYKYVSLHFITPNVKDVADLMSKGGWKGPAGRIREQFGLPLEDVLPEVIDYVTIGVVGVDEEPSESTPMQEQTTVDNKIAPTIRIRGRDCKDYLPNLYPINPYLIIVAVVVVCILVVVAVAASVWLAARKDPAVYPEDLLTTPKNTNKLIVDISIVTKSTVTDVCSKLANHKGTVVLMDVNSLKSSGIWTILDCCKASATHLEINGAIFDEEDGCLDMSTFENRPVEMLNVVSFTLKHSIRCFVKSGMCGILKFTPKLKIANIAAGAARDGRAIIKLLNDTSPGFIMNSL